jgi:hypothetical protein
MIIMVETKHTLYNWMMENRISRKAYRSAIDSGKISENNSKTLLISESMMEKWALIGYKQDLDVII